VLEVSAARRQRFKRSGIAIKASCSPGCSIRYTTKLTGTKRRDGDPGLIEHVTARRATRVRIYDDTYEERYSPNASVRDALRRGRVVRATVTLTPVDDEGITQGQSATLRVRLTR
jgi:hypothetical protein